MPWVGIFVKTMTSNRKGLEFTVIWEILTAVVEGSLMFNHWNLKVLFSLFWPIFLFFWGLYSVYYKSFNNCSLFENSEFCLGKKNLFPSDQDRNQVLNVTQKQYVCILYNLIIIYPKTISNNPNSLFKSYKFDTLIQNFLSNASSRRSACWSTTDSSFWLSFPSFRSSNSCFSLFIPKYFNPIAWRCKLFISQPRPQDHFLDDFQNGGSSGKTWVTWYKNFFSRDILWRPKQNGSQSWVQNLLCKAETLHEAVMAS